MDLKVQNGRGPRGEIRVNGDKSITHRALMIGSLAGGVSTIRGRSLGRDCRSTQCALTKLGIRISEEDSVISIKGRGLFGYTEPLDILDCGNSGTTMRLLAGLLAGQSFLSVLTGDESLRTRPMDRVIKPLTSMGAMITARTGGQFAPLCISGKRLTALDYAAPIASAQVKSAVLFAGLHARGETSFSEKRPTRDHTERMLEYFGVHLRRKENRIAVSAPANIIPRELFIPGDISSAAFFIAWAAAVPGSELHIRDVGLNPGRTGILKALAMMGARIDIVDEQVLCNEPVGEIVVRGSRCRGLEVPVGLIPNLIDELPVLAVAATQAEGVTTVRGARELRVKECDRIKGTVSGLKRMGADIVEQADGFIVEGPVKLRGAEVESFNDHRIAMSLAIAGFIAEGETMIRGADCIAVSFPEFIDIAERLGVECRPG